MESKGIQNPNKTQPNPLHPQEAGKLMEVNISDQCTLHIFRTSLGLMFSMSEISVELFKENPGAFNKDVRGGRYKRFHVTDEDVLLQLAQLKIPPESISVIGATLLPPESFEAILRHRRKAELVTVVRVALFNVVVADAAKLLGQGLFEEALPVALDAIHKGRLLYYPHHKLQLLPAYLLGAQANLCLKRTMQSEDMLGIAAWLLVNDDSQTNKIPVYVEITRLFGQLYFLQRKYDIALKAWGENVFYTSLQYGHMDLRNTVGLYNISKIFQEQDEFEKSRRCSDVVVEMWLTGLKEVVLGIPYEKITPWGKPHFPGLDEKHWDFKSQINALYFKEVTDMLQDISTYRAKTSGGKDESVAESCLALGLAFTYSKLFALATQHLEHAADLYIGRNAQDSLYLINQTLKLIPKAYVV